MSTATAAPASADRRSGVGFYLCCIAALACCATALGWHAVQLRSALDRNHSGADPRALAELLSTPLPSTGAGTLRLADIPAAKLLLFVLTPADCAACLPELEDLERIQAARRDLRVVGVLAHSNVDEARQTAENFNLTFPLVVDEDGHLVEALRLPRTPWKLVVDGRRAILYFQDPPSLTLMERQAFVERIGRIGHE
jgi:peroxiredoxin